MGAIESSEDPQTAAIRQLVEETSLVATEDELDGMRTPTSLGGSDDLTDHTIVNIADLKSMVKQGHIDW